MSNRTFYNEVLTDHNIHPENKFKIKDFTFEKEGVNPSCGDDIVLQIKYEDGVITDAAFVGERLCHFTGIYRYHDKPC